MRDSQSDAIAKVASDSATSPEEQNRGHLSVQTSETKADAPTPNFGLTGPQRFVPTGSQMGPAAAPSRTATRTQPLARAPAPDE